MAWFTDDFNRFFKDLAKNNNKEWFDANRKRYEASVKLPFEAFVGEVIERVGKLDKTVRITAKEAVFRINRDVRFGKDKSPYKLQMAAIISSAGRKDHGIPGIYLQLGPENVGIYGGRYMPEKADLQRIREHIAANLKKFKAIQTEKAFVKHFGEIQGERNKVLPAEFKALVEKEPLIANKQFYYMAELPSRTVVDPKLVDIVMAHYKAMKPMNDFLA